MYPFVHVHNNVTCYLRIRQAITFTKYDPLVLCQQRRNAMAVLCKQKSATT